MTPYASFDDWFYEVEGFGLRAERFDGDVEWLKAAFEAGRESAQVAEKTTPPQKGESNARFIAGPENGK